ncbi:hypothetical protein [Actinacidiphila glaucinigra]|uniref:hypothetical protein n=1 Tax=Actinacidiphila glaucinigra TaxID=235986 RepID=UPI003670A715
MNLARGVFLVDADDGTTRKAVWFRPPGDGSDVYLGDVSDTVGGGWLAEYYAGPDHNAEKIIGVPGFMDAESAADFIYTFLAPVISSRTKAHLRPRDLWISGTVDFRGKTPLDVANALREVIERIESGQRTGYETHPMHSFTYTAGTTF